MSGFHILIQKIHRRIRLLGDLLIAFFCLPQRQIDGFCRAGHRAGQTGYRLRDLLQIFLRLACLADRRVQHLRGAVGHTAQRGNDRCERINQIGGIIQFPCQLLQVHRKVFHRFLAIGFIKNLRQAIQNIQADLRDRLREDLIDLFLHRAGALICDLRRNRVLFLVQII